MWGKWLCLPPTALPLTFDAFPLTHDALDDIPSPLSAQVKRYSGSASDIDMRAEVGLVSSNIVITAADGPTTYVRGTGELFGARVVVAGNSTARISHVSV